MSEDENVYRMPGNPWRDAEEAKRKLVKEILDECRDKIRAGGERFEARVWEQKREREARQRQRKDATGR